MQSGRVKWFNDAKGYGFIEGEGGAEDVFVHYSAIQAGGFRTLREGDAVVYAVQQTGKGMQATQVERADLSGAEGKAR